MPSIEDGGVEKNLFIISNYLKNCGISLEILTSSYDKSKKFTKKHIPENVKNNSNKS